MAIRITATMKVEAAGAAGVSKTHAIAAEAYDKIEVTVPERVDGTDGTLTVQVQPGAAGQVLLLMISASNYTVGVNYAIDGGTAIALDSPQMYVGGSVRPLGAIQEVVFTNPHDEAVDVALVLARDATPPP